MCRFVDRVTVKGKTSAVSVFKINDAATEQSIEIKPDISIILKASGSVFRAKFY
ncbi:hypothetical protein [Microcoleus sp. D2_18a_B4]|uniref:hypothetical protein n=1 Tax=Microcoleus sp. D2_18a_B4 TaxID=3055329 RepID=UPI002FD2AFFB